MADLILQFPRSQYPSLQVGDIGYYAKMNTEEVDNGNVDENGDPILEFFVALTGGFQTDNPDEDFIEIGEVTLIDNSTALSDGTLTTSVTFDIDEATPQPGLLDFIFFGKNDKASLGSSANINKCSPVGYFAKVKFKNTSSEKSEMFSAACEVNESSK